MEFYEKLDFLMNITKTSNSALAQRVKLDASHISRLRRGKRNATRDETCIEAMAVYFSRHCTENYQRKALSDALGTKLAPVGDERLAEQIAQWLIQRKKNEVKTVQTFLSGLTGMKLYTKKPPGITPADLPQTRVTVGYGKAGKRQVVATFLSRVLAQDEPRTLLLFSDENTDWLTEDKTFAAKWAMLMSGVLSKGNRIRIIHTVSRDLDEMLYAISHWMPLYMTGAIEPYYYPKKRDGIFKRTLFVAPEVAAVVASSVGDMIDTACNLLVSEPQAIAAFAQEFDQYFSLCKPLMQIFASGDKREYFRTLLEFEAEQGNAVIKTESLSLLTMPRALVSHVIARLGGNEMQAEYHQTRVKVFESNLQEGDFYEIIWLSDIERVLQNQIKLAFSVVLSGVAAYYTAQEYIQHLEHIVHLLETYDHFHVFLLQEAEEAPYMVYAKEDLGCIVAKTSAPPVILAINETNMTAAFWDFLKSMVGENDYRHPNNAGTAQRLNAYILRLKEAAGETVYE